MKKLKITINISEDVAEMLESRVPEEERNVFIENAIRSRFAMMEQEKVLQDVVMHNKILNDELDQIDAGLQLEDFMTEDDDLLSDDELSEFDNL